MSYNPVRTLLIPILMLHLFALAGCGLQLKEPPSPPATPVEGFWVELHGDGAVLLHLFSSEDRDGVSPLHFVWERRIRRDLLFSGRRVYVTHREGTVVTSAHEMLLVQESYRFSYWPEDKIGSSYPVGAGPYGEEAVQTQLESRKNWRILRLDREGNSLTDTGGLVLSRVADRFERGQKSGSKTGIAGNGLSLQGKSLSGIVGIVDSGHSMVTLYRMPARDRALSAIAPGSEGIVFGESGHPGRLQLVQCITGECMASIKAPPVEKGDLVYLPAENPLPGSPKTERERAIQRIRSGKEIPREELIRLLEEGSPASATEEPQPVPSSSKPSR